MARPGGARVIGHTTNAKVYNVSCVVDGCERRVESSGHGFDAAFFNTPIDHKGWKIRRTPSGDHYEMRCPGHAVDSD